MTEHKALVKMSLFYVFIHDSVSATPAELLAV